MFDTNAVWTFDRTPSPPPPPPSVWRVWAARLLLSLQWLLSHLLQYNKNTSRIDDLLHVEVLPNDGLVKSANVDLRPWSELLKPQRTFVVNLVLAMKLYLYYVGGPFDVVNTRTCYDSVQLTWNSVAIKRMLKAVCTKLSIPSTAEKEPG